MNRIALELPNLVGGHYKLVVEPTDEYCPLCGGRELWVEVGVVDFEVGPTFYCPSCGRCGCMEWPSNQDNRVIAAIRAVLAT